MFTDHAKMRNALMSAMEQADCCWTDLLANEELSGARDLIIDAAVKAKSRLQTAVECATFMFDSNLICMAHILQLNRDQEKTSTKYADNSKVSIL